MLHSPAEHEQIEATDMSEDPGREEATSEKGASPDRITDYSREGKGKAAADRKLQERAEARNRQRKAQQEGQDDEPYQPADRDEPATPYPEQHQQKPGVEADLVPRPRYRAPTYRGSGKLEDRVALVTGGDSGIGRAVAVLFAREGADVGLVYLSEHGDADETQAAVEEEGRRALLIPGDVTNPEFCRDAVERTVDAFGKLDILVNNAAFQEHVYDIEDLSEEHFDRTVKTNLYGYFHMVKAALPHLGSGSVILNTGSVTGIRGKKTLPDYSMTKGGIHAFTRALAQNLLDRGIRVNGVAPGPVWTPLNPADAEAEDVAEFGRGTPMQRPAQPEEISPAYVFLAAPSCSSYITGTVLPVLGGETIQ